MLVLLSCRNPKAKSPEGETHEEGLSLVAESDEPKVTLEAAAYKGRKGKKVSKRRRGGIAEEAIEDVTPNFKEG
ncbi:hypothetical protein RHGRI_020262 [Rhododendron griersonianum]|uniref:Uncharacterized protein n=1 Tax=Rhododendron griersonianum TaxID=479676 RepID=A0AAV6JIR0_9ERIC|nr:hypothetical protein RHGRI_020262 [Rhododendron griersonianum]